MELGVELPIVLVLALLAHVGQARSAQAAFDPTIHTRSFTGITISVADCRCVVVSDGNTNRAAPYLPRRKENPLCFRTAENNTINVLMSNTAEYMFGPLLLKSSMMREDSSAHQLDSQSSG